MASKRKQDEKHLNLLRGMAKLDHNKQCIDCNQRGPTYLNMTIGAFVCTSCSGLLRGLTPPHRVKSISMASFTTEEIEFVRSRGNEFCRKVWLGLHDNRNIDFLGKDENKLKDFMVLKYEKKRYYVAPTEIMMEEARQQNTPPKVETQAKPLRSLGNINTVIPHQVSSQSTKPTGSVERVVGPQSNDIQPIRSSGTVQEIKIVRTEQTKTSGGLDLLGELAGDPFSESQSKQQQQQGFADFGSVGTSTQMQIPHSLSQPGGFSPLNVTGAGIISPMPSGTQTISTSGSIQPTVVQSNSFGAFPLTTTSAVPQSLVKQDVTSGGDKYSALAELDSVFGGISSGSKSVNWDGTSGMSDSTSVFGSIDGIGINEFQQTPQNLFSSIPAMNPFGSTSHQNTTLPAANPFSSSTEGFLQPPSGFNQNVGCPMNLPTNNSIRVFDAPFGSANTTASNRSGQYGASNGNMNLQQQLWTSSNLPQGQINLFNSVGMNLEANVPGINYGKPQETQNSGQNPQNQQFRASWGSSQPAANPFMNIANQPTNRPLNSTNPFL